MKIGVTISDFYKSYLQEIAKLNGCSVTSICGLIVENFLSFNKEKERYPLFKKYVGLVFANQHHSDNDDGQVPEMDEETIRIAKVNWLDE